MSQEIPALPPVAQDPPLLPTTEQSSTQEPTPSQPPPAKKAKKARAANQKKTTNMVSLPPERILVIDNGGDTLKYGWNDDNQPRVMPNVTARLPQQWAVLAGDELSRVKNPNQLIGVKRSTERGVINDMGNMILVWKRLLDSLGVSIPMNDTFQAFGWKVNKQSKIQAGTCAVLLVLPPLTPRNVLDQMALVWLEDFGFSHVGFCAAPVPKPHNSYETQCRVDLGWSCVTITPSYRGKAVIDAIRRVPLGGRHLVEIWKYYASYRYYSLPDFIMKDVVERLGYVSRDFGGELDRARRLPAGRRPFDREYVLPDYHTYMEGRIRIPPALQGSQEEEQDDESYTAEQGHASDSDRDDVDGDKNDVEEDVDSDEETLEEKKKRLLRERAEEERRKREEATEEQVLHVSTERFCVSEALFQPSVCYLPKEWAGIHNAIIQSIQMCPEALQIAMYRSIYLCGGLVQMDGLVERLQKELRSLVPCDYNMEISVSKSPIFQSWLDAVMLTKCCEYVQWSVSREEWEDSKRKGSWDRLLSTNNGFMI